VRVARLRLLDSPYLARELAVTSKVASEYQTDSLVGGGKTEPIVYT
jgi:hypothetical protein